MGVLLDPLFGEGLVHPLPLYDVNIAPHAPMSIKNVAMHKIK
jgi:hypothetical protein